MNHLRIGIFGGTFDPVHQGHIEVARRVRSLLSLDRVEFLPAYRPPHKLGPPVANAWHRFAMLTLATDEDEGLYVSTLELEARRPVYTIDTIRQLKAIWTPPAELVFIVGADSFEEILSWRDAHRLLQSCHFAVMTRPGHSLGAEHLPTGVRQRILDLRAANAPPRLSDGYHIFLCGGVSSPISSTSIRQALRERRPVKALMPAVRRHIEKYQLYREADEARIHSDNFTSSA